MVVQTSLLPTVLVQFKTKTTGKTKSTPTTTSNHRILRRQWIPFLAVAFFVICQIHTFKPSIYRKTEIDFHIEEEKHDDKPVVVTDDDETEAAATTTIPEPRSIINHIIITTTTNNTIIKRQSNKDKKENDNSHNKTTNNNVPLQFCNDCIVNLGFNKYKCDDRAKYLATIHYNGDMAAAQKSLFEKNECIIILNNNNKTTSTSTPTSSSSAATGDNDGIGFCNHCMVAVGFNKYKCDERAKYLSTAHYKGNLKEAQKYLIDDGQCRYKNDDIQFCNHCMVALGFSTYKCDERAKYLSTAHYNGDLEEAQRSITDKGDCSTYNKPIPRHELCFVTSDFADSIEMADLPPTLAKEMITIPKRHFLFTNLPSLEVEDGWNKIVMNSTQLPFKRKITQSRWPKFLGWKHPSLSHCRVIFYGDTYLMNPIEEPMWMGFAKTILGSSQGLMQQKQIGTYKEGPEAELNVTANTGKATRSISLKTVDWLRSQEDYNPRSRVYKNAIIGYDPRNPKFRNLTEDFWFTYSKEELTWRDQPIWSYVLEKHHITPIPMTELPLEGVGKKGFNNHKYNATVNSQ